MLINIILDFGVGLVPFLGDIADAIFRANTRNAILLEQHLRDKGIKNLEAQNQPSESSTSIKYNESAQKVIGKSATNFKK
ncbi:unnamed protein product [Trifolium pratense]|uniref:Uncharacterized protein n=1 Tax=Trifolium pratense TaxID=57577 RepID=A0ACB0JPE8_TRIPR|nr:unnamed protein product [Trifolium pratense]